MDEHYFWHIHVIFCPLRWPESIAAGSSYTERIGKILNLRIYFKSLIILQTLLSIWTLIEFWWRPNIWERWENDSSVLAKVVGDSFDEHSFTKAKASLDSNTKKHDIRLFSLSSEISISKNHILGGVIVNKNFIGLFSGLNCWKLSPPHLADLLLSPWHNLALVWFIVGFKLPAVLPITGHFLLWLH